MNPKCVVDVGIYFKPIILDIAERAKSLILNDGPNNSRLQKKLAVCLGLILEVCPELERYVSRFPSSDSTLNK